MEVRPPKDFLRHYVIVHFRLPVEKLCFRFEIVCFRGDIGGKMPPNDFPQALPSCALYIACEETIFHFRIYLVQGRRCR